MSVSSRVSRSISDATAMFRERSASGITGRSTTPVQKRTTVKLSAWYSAARSPFHPRILSPESQNSHSPVPTPRRHDLRAIAITVLLVLSAPQSSSAQFPPERATNLKVLPVDISMDSLVSLMGGFTRALGVRCAYCHVQQEGQTLEQIDFSLDGNPTKNTAREMLRMVDAINAIYLAGVSTRRQPDIQVTCVTCHRGIIEPRPLQQVLLNAFDAAGADSAESMYRRLRDRYYGRGSYDFGEVPLADFATAIAARGSPSVAIRFHTLNTVMNPGSTFALRQLAEAHLAVRDTTSAIAAFERAVTINPNDSQSRRSLVGLKRLR